MRKDPKPWQCLWFAALVLSTSGLAQDQSPFTVSATLATNNGLPAVQVQFGVPANHHLYADKLAVHVDDRPLAKITLPEPTLVQDKFSGKTKHVFTRPFAGVWQLPDPVVTNTMLSVELQGCDEANCYFPETRSFTISAAGTITELKEALADAAEASSSAEEWRALAEQFKITTRGSGYMTVKNFLAMLNGGSSADGGLASPLQRWGWMVTLGLILAGGLGLNLTPCVLPMIPINLSIIGAGAGNGNRRRGFALGATYGLGMAAAYGALGLFVVATGSKFGTLNSSAWFNLAIGAIFLVLALGMFDVLPIDLSRFQGRVGGDGAAASRGPFAVALTMGTVAALLAGACVAPVVISVLLLATNLYNGGAWMGLALPFLLGIGMALPWPFAGAGLSLLPKPGRWMQKVKYGFGVMIVLMAVYYGQVAYGLMRTSAAPLVANAVGQVSGTESETANAALAGALREALQQGKPVLVDFWAGWCKNCSAMEHSTFQDPQVQARLGAFRLVKYQAERPNQPPAKPVLDYFGVMGLPTYIILEPRAANMAAVR